MAPPAPVGDHRGIDVDAFSLADLPDPASDQPILTGTSVAVAGRLQVSTLAVRIAFVLLTLSAGLGIALYAVAWLSLGHGRRMVGAGPGIGAASRDPARNIGFGLIVLAVVVGTVDAGWAPAVMWPAAIVALGVAVAWRQAAGTAATGGIAATGGTGGTDGSGAADADSQRVTPSGAEADRVIGSDLLRQGAGLALVMLGVGVLLLGNITFASLVAGVVAGVVVTAGIALVLGPWMLRAARATLEERRERVRSEERAAMAEHLHDSVLQTLTLIQKRTASAPDVDARAISALARRQERELRRWLYGHGDDPDGSSFRATMEAVVADVEDMHNVTVEAVLVGDAPLDPALDAVTGAVREALVNAAKFSGRADISLFVELGESAVSAFVRDRGLGFDPSSVPADRHGIRDSITGRVQRQGGMAAVRSTPGGGTEVEVRVPRRQAHPDAQPDAEPGVPADEVPR